MAIRTFNSVGGFSVGEVPVQVIANTGDIGNVANATIGNITATTKIIAGNVTSNNLTNTQVTFTKDGVLSDSANFTFTGGNVLTVKDAANIVSSDGANYISLTGSNGQITSTGNANLANGAFTITTDGDANIANSLTVGYSSADGDSAFYVDAAGNFSIKIANASAPGGFTTVFNVDSTSGNITTAGSVVSPGGGAATISAPGANTQVLFNDGGNVGAVDAFTFDKSSNTLTVTGSANITNSLDVNGVLNLWDDLFIDGGNISSPSYVVLPQGGYLYDGNDGNSIRLHAETNGYAQLEYLNDAWVWVNNQGAFMESDNNQISAWAGGNVEIAVDGNSWYFAPDGNLSTPGSIWANAGNFELNGYANVGGTLTVGGIATLQSDAIVEGALNVTATTNLFDNVTIGIVNGVTADLEVSGDTYLRGNLEVDGEANLYNLHVQNHVTSDLIPDINADGSGAGYDLGSSSYRWKDLWLSGLTINLGNTTISSGGSNNMIVGNAIIGYAGALTGYTSPTVGNLYAGYLTTSNNTSIGNSSARANLAVSGNLTVDDTAAATSTTSGAFQVKGGVGIGGNIYVGGAQANITGNVLIEGTEANISTGNLRIGGNANVVHDMVIGGNLTVSGTTTYVNTTNSSLTDPLIDIAGNGSGGDLTGGDLYDRGLYIHNYAGGAAVNQFMGWKQGDGEFQLKTGVSTSGNAVTGGTYANLRLDTLYTDHLYGTVETVDQPNIANMSGLFDISVSNLADINLAQVTTLVASGLNYPLNDGSAPQDNEVVVLRTDGAANLTFEIIHTDRIGNATSGIFVNADGNVEVTANSNLTFTVTETGANVVGDFDVTGLLSAGSLNVGSLTPESITIGDTNIDDSTVTTHDDQQHVVAEVPAVAGNAVEFFVKGKSVVGGVTYATVATVTAMYDGTNVDFATYGKLHMPSGGTGAGSLTVNYGGGNIQLLATPSQNADTLWTAQIRTI